MRRTDIYAVLYGLIVAVTVVSPLLFPVLAVLIAVNVFGFPYTMRLQRSKDIALSWNPLLFVVAGFGLAWSIWTINQLWDYVISGKCGVTRGWGRVKTILDEREKQREKRQMETEKGGTVDFAKLLEENERAFAEADRWRREVDRDRDRVLRVPDVR